MTDRPVKLTPCQAALLTWLREQPGIVRCRQAGDFLHNGGHLQGKQSTNASHRCRIGGRVLMALYRRDLAWRNHDAAGDLIYGINARGRTATVEVSETQLGNGRVERGERDGNGRSFFEGLLAAAEECYARRGEWDRADVPGVGSDERGE